MATIEERAKEWAEIQLRDHYDYATMGDIRRKVWRDSYINEYRQIAEEQKAIDDAELAEVRRQRDAYYDELLKLRVKRLEWIDKALDAHCEYCDHTCPHNGMECYIRENIRKSMEK